jgi:hypothetical protein
MSANDFRRHLAGRGKRFHFSDRILNQALAAARKRRRQAAQYAEERRRQWLDQHRAAQPQQAVREETVLIYDLGEPPASVPPPGSADRVYEIVRQHALERPGRTVPEDVVRHALEDEGLIGYDLTRAIIHDALERRLVQRTTTGLYLMP